MSDEAECAFCGTALPLENCPHVAGGQIIRTVPRYPFVVNPHAIH